MITGWTGEDTGAPALPLTAALMANRERGAGDALEIAAMRSRAADARQLLEEDARRPDPDERAAGLVARGVMPGLVSDIGQRLADTEAELAAEREKIERGERVSARVRGMLERGQVGGFEASRMLDGDFGDPARAEKLERRADALRRQAAEVSQLIPRPEDREPADPFEAATRRARTAGHEAFAERTRDLMAQAEAGRPLPRRAPRPFGGRGGVAVRSEQLAVRSEMCVYCTAAGVSDETAYLLHSDPEFNVPVTPPGSAAADAYPAEPSRSAAYGRTITRAAGGAIAGTR